MKRLTLALATAAIAVLPLSACGSSSSSTTSASTAVSATTAVSSPSASDTATTSPSATSSTSTGASASASTATLPAGDKLVSAPSSKVQFAVPKEWVNFDAKLLDSAKGRELIAPMAQKMGMTTDQFLQRMRERNDVYVISPTPVNGFSNNANAVKPSDSADLDLVADQLKQEFQKEGATVSKQTHVQTSLGEGLRTDYTLPMGSTKVTGVSLVLPAPGDKMVPVTVSAGNAAQADKLAQDIIASYRAA